MHTIFLKTALFTLPKDGHVPVGAVVLEGEITDRPSGGLEVAVTGFKDGRGKALEGEPVKLHLPWSKVDHVQIND